MNSEPDPTWAAHHKLRYDMIRAAQFAYYCLGVTFWSDQKFDAAEKEFPYPIPLGSDNALHYTDNQRTIAHVMLAAQV